MTNADKVQRFLKDIASINLKYEKLNEANGSNFNIFSIIRKGTEEVELHSRFIGELLDPKGSHNKKDLFLRLFIEQFQLKNKNNEIIQGDFELFIEKSVGEYGRIDLLIKSKDELIIIENKIYANDQPTQLQRYSEAAKKEYSFHNLNLFYLTLYGEEPSSNSLGNLNVGDVKCISYADDIKDWLEACAKEVYDIPVIRETITQYKNLIEKLTGQSINEEQKMEVQDLLLTDYNFEHALAIESVLQDTKIKIQKTLWKELKNELSTSKCFDFSFVDSNFDAKNYNICNKFYAVRNKSYRYGLQYKVMRFNDYSVHLYIEVHSRLYFGLTVRKDNVKGAVCSEFEKEYPKHAALLSSLNLLTRKDTHRWLGWKYTEEKINFYDFNEGSTAKLANKSFRESFVKNTVEEICELLDKCKKYSNANL